MSSPLSKCFAAKIDISFGIGTSIFNKSKNLALFSFISVSAFPRIFFGKYISLLIFALNETQFCFKLIYSSNVSCNLNDLTMPVSNATAKLVIVKTRFNPNFKFGE